MKGVMGVCVVMALLATPAMAIVINFNAPAYSDGDLYGQTDPCGSTWTGNATGAGSGTIVVGGTATNGSMHAVTAASQYYVQLDLPTPVEPGADGHIRISMDLTNVTGQGGNALKMGFQDASGNELARAEVQGVQARGRGAGGTSTVTAVMAVSQYQTRVLWVDIDTAGAGGNVYFYQDSIAPANQLLVGGQAVGIPYTDTNETIGRIMLETFNPTAAPLPKISMNVDNINITPEPTALSLLVFGGLLIRRRR